jgi:hypothetical protein
MQEGSKRLHEVLKTLVEEGSITPEQSELVDSRFEALDGSDSRKSIFAEIAAYLGGAFVVIAVLFIAGKFWGEAPRAVQTAAAAIVSIALLTIAHLLGDSNAMRLRLTSVLSMGAAIAATGAGAFAADTNGAPWFPFLTGTAVALYSFIRYRHEILHIGCYGFLFITGFMTIGRFYGVEPDQSAVYALWWVALGSVWFYLSFERKVDQTLGYLISMATFFVASQFLFATDHRVISYLIAVVAAPASAFIFLTDRKWPLLFGAVAITTVTTGEFVASTLGGSLGALIGLLAAGITLISTSMVAIRKSR